MIKEYQSDYLPANVSIDNDVLEILTGDIISLTLPNSLTKIGPYAFYKCSRLTEIEIPEGLTSIGMCAFLETKLKNLEIPSTVETIGENILGQNSLIEKITFPLTGGDWTDNSRNTLSYLFGVSTGAEPYAYSLTDVIINGGTTVADYGFSNFDYLRRIELGDSIITIGEYAFNGFDEVLESIKLSKNLKTVGDHAFYDSGGSGSYVVENVYFNGTLKDWCNIEFLGIYSNPIFNGNHLYILDENNSFFELTATSTLSIPEEVTEIGRNQFQGLVNIENVLIPEGVIKLGYSAFDDCNLTSITIPSTVTEIDSFLTRASTINFTGTKSQWEAITKSSLWNYYSDATYIQCSDGKYYL